MFISTDGLFDKNYKINLNQLIVNAEELGIIIFGISLGYYLYEYLKLYKNIFWVIESNQIQLPLSFSFGNEISYSQKI